MQQVEIKVKEVHILLKIEIYDLSKKTTNVNTGVDNKHTHIQPLKSNIVFVL